MYGQDMNNMQYMYPYNGMYQSRYNQPMFGNMQDSFPVDQYAAIGVRWVNGIDEVRNAVTPFGKKTMFMDMNKPMFYIRDVDISGIASVSQFEFATPVENNEQVNKYVTLEQMNNALSEMEAKYESAISAATASSARNESVGSRLQQQSENINGSDAINSQVWQSTASQNSIRPNGQEWAGNTATSK